MASSNMTQDKFTLSPGAPILPHPLSLQTELTALRESSRSVLLWTTESSSLSRSPTKKMQDKSSPARTLHRRSINSAPQNSLESLLNCACTHAYKHTVNSLGIFVYLLSSLSLFFLPTLPKYLCYLIGNWLYDWFYTSLLSELLWMEWSRHFMKHCLI